MKRIILNLFLLFSVGAYAQHGTNNEQEEVEDEGHHCLFKKNSVSIGVGLPYSFHLNDTGINSRVYYNMGEHICFGPEFSYFKKEDLAVIDLNLVGHYIFETKFVGLYPLTGVNYTIETDPHETLKELGWVIGGGLHRNFGLLTVMAEYAHIQSNLRDDFVTLGVMFTIK